MTPEQAQAIYRRELKRQYDQGIVPDPVKAMAKVLDSPSELPMRGIEEILEQLAHDAVAVLEALRNGHDTLTPDGARVFSEEGGHEVLARAALSPPSKKTNDNPVSTDERRAV